KGPSNRRDWTAQARELDSYTQQDARATVDLFRALAREIVLAALVLDLEKEGSNAYLNTEARLNTKIVSDIVNELTPFVAEAVIREYSIRDARRGAPQRGEGKNLLNVLELSRDWHKQIHGPLRHIRTIPVEGAWHGLLLDPNGAELSQLTVELT